MLSLLLTASLPGASDEKRVAIYSLVANYSLPVYDQGGQDYVGLLEILEPLGTVTSQTNGTRWKLRYNDVESQFTSNTSRARIQNHDVDLPANFILASGRGLVSLSSLGTLLPQSWEGQSTSMKIHAGFTSAALEFISRRRLATVIRRLW